MFVFDGGSNGAAPVQALLAPYRPKVPDLDGGALLRAVAEIAVAARPEDPASISQGVFDRFVEQDPERADLPKARHIARIMRLPWRGLV